MLIKTNIITVQQNHDMRNLVGKGWQDKQYMIDNVSFHQLTLHSYLTKAIAGNAISIIIINNKQSLEYSYR